MKFLLPTISKSSTCINITNERSARFNRHRHESKAWVEGTLWCSYTTTVIHHAAGCLTKPYNVPLQSTMVGTSWSTVTKASVMSKEATNITSRYCWFLQKTLRQNASYNTWWCWWKQILPFWAHPCKLSRHAFTSCRVLHRLVRTIFVDKRFAPSATFSGEIKTPRPTSLEISIWSASASSSRRASPSSSGSACDSNTYQWVIQHLHSTSRSSSSKTNSLGSSSLMLHLHTHDVLLGRWQSAALAWSLTGVQQRSITLLLLHCHLIALASCSQLDSIHLGPRGWGPMEGFGTPTSGCPASADGSGASCTSLPSKQRIQRNCTWNVQWYSKPLFFWRRVITSLVTRLFKGQGFRIHNALVHNQLGPQQC